MVNRLKQLSLNASYCELEGEDLKTENPKKAIEMFEKVVSLEASQGDQVKW